MRVACTVHKQEDDDSHTDSFVDLALSVINAGKNTGLKSTSFIHTQNKQT